MQTDLLRENEMSGAETDKLQELLRSELSAVETYGLALNSIKHVELNHTIQEILTSHARRAEQIRARIGRGGMDPATTSGVWGAFVKVFQAGADLLGDRVALGALEQGEDRYLDLYSANLQGWDPTTRRLIETELLPAQRHTRALCQTLKSYVKTPG